MIYRSKMKPNQTIIFYIYIKYVKNIKIKVIFTTTERNIKWNVNFLKKITCHLTQSIQRVFHWLNHAKNSSAHLAKAVEYAHCIFAEGVRFPFSIECPGYDTKLHLIVWLQSWCFAKNGVLLHCNYFQANFDPER